MWQTKYASVVPKNLGVGVDFRPCSEGDFLTGRLYSVSVAIQHIHPYSIYTVHLQWGQIISKIFKDYSFVFKYFYKI